MKNEKFEYLYAKKLEEVYNEYFADIDQFDVKFKKILKKEFELLGKSYAVTKIVYDCLNLLCLEKSTSKLEYFKDNLEKIYKNLADTINYLGNIIFFHR